MRDALLHLRLLTLPVDKLPRLRKYLSTDEMSFLGRQLCFKRTEQFPPSLSANTSPRIRATSVDLHILELIPKNLIITNLYETIGKKLHNSKLRDEHFRIDLEARQNLCLKGVEILTRVSNYPEFKQAEDNPNRYT